MKSAGTLQVLPWYGKLTSYPCAFAKVEPLYAFVELKGALAGQHFTCVEVEFFHAVW